MSTIRWLVAAWQVWRGVRVAILWPSKVISFCSDAVSVKADSRALFPCPDLSSIRFIAGVIIYTMLGSRFLGVAHRIPHTLILLSSSSCRVLSSPKSCLSFTVVRKCEYCFNAYEDVKTMPDLTASFMACMPTSERNCSMTGTIHQLGR